jgi:hypothetical protein
MWRVYDGPLLLRDFVAIKAQWRAERADLLGQVVDQREKSNGEHPRFLRFAST